MRNSEIRLANLEQRLQQYAKLVCTYGPECICYPKGSTPWVAFFIQYEIAFYVKCPAHGDRFSWDDVGMFVYRVKWFREKMHSRTLDGCPGLGFFSKYPRKVTEQFRKAYLASFPRDLWTAEEEGKTEEGYLKTYLRLQDGTRIQVDQHGRAKPNYDGEPSREEIARLQKLREKCERAVDRIWEMETLRTVGRLLSQRGRVVDPRLLG